jgi:hypothetical protein
MDIIKTCPKCGCIYLFNFQLWKWVCPNCELEQITYDVKTSDQAISKDEA